MKHFIREFSIWAERKRRRLAKMGTYIVDEEDDTEIVETKQNVRVEQDTGQ